MAKVTARVDDLALRSGKHVPATRLDIPLSFDGVEITLDLSQENYDALSAVVSPWLKLPGGEVEAPEVIVSVPVVEPPKAAPAVTPRPAFVSPTRKTPGPKPQGKANGGRRFDKAGTAPQPGPYARRGAATRQWVLYPDITRFGKEYGVKTAGSPSQETLDLYAEAVTSGEFVPDRDKYPDKYNRDLIKLEDWKG